MSESTNKKYYNPITKCCDLDTKEEQEKIYARRRAKKFYEKNKEEFLKKITCECGKIVSYKHSTSPQHINSKQHQNYMDSLKLCVEHRET